MKISSKLLLASLFLSFISSNSFATDLACKKFKAAMKGSIGSTSNMDKNSKFKVLAKLYGQPVEADLKELLQMDEESYKDCNNTISVAFFQVAGSEDLLKLSLTSEGICDGDNTYGILTNLTKNKKIGSVTDYDINCDK